MAKRAVRAGSVRSRKRSLVHAPNWRVDLSDFGKIKRASISMAPFVMLVGKNNTGKSHVASLIWALLNAEETVFHETSKNPIPDWFVEFLERPNPENPAIKEQLNSSHIASMEAWLNRELSAKRNSIVRNVLSYKGASIDELKVSFPRDLRIDIEATHLDGIEYSGTYNCKLSSAGRVSISIGVSQPRHAISLPNLFFGFIVDTCLSGTFAPNNRTRAVYIPAARTGLMLAFRPLVSRLLDNFGLQSAPDTQGGFPLPVVRFLQALTRSGEGATSGISAIADDLERDIIHGHVERTEGTVPEFTYTPARFGKSLPLHVSSSMVTELAPFMVLLRQGNINRGVVFEEPEAHLHLSAQRTIAKALAKLVNQGVPVVVTTHSDTFVQQINLSMEMFAHENRNELMQKYGYSEDELISPSQARAYEFVETGGRTHVVELPQEASGFAVPSLNEALEGMAGEIFAVTADDL